MKKLDKKNWANKVIKSSNISIRKASFSDIEFLWYLRNRPEVYKYFRNTKSVNWKIHVNWIIPIILGTSLKSVFVIQKSGIPIGQIRFDYQTSDISISILKEFQGKGVALYALILVIKEIKRRGKNKKIVAEIHKNNFSSIKLFEKLKFKFEAKNGKWLRYILNL